MHRYQYKQPLTTATNSPYHLCAKSIQHHHRYRTTHAPVFIYLWMKKETMKGKPLFRVQIG